MLFVGILPTVLHPSGLAVVLSFLGTVLCTLALVAWLAPGLDGVELIGKGPFGGSQNAVLRAYCAVLLIGSLVSTYAVVPAIIILAILVIVLLHPLVAPRREIPYILALALVTGLATLMSPARLVPTWVNGGIAVLTVTLALTAGWALLRCLGLLECGVGRSLFLTDGPRPEFRSGHVT